MKYTYLFAYLVIVVVFLNWAAFDFITIGAIGAIMMNGGVLHPGSLFAGIFVINELGESLRYVPDMINNMI